MYGLCILRIYRVVSVLFSIHYLYRCYSNQWPDYLFKRISYFFRDSGTPQFISKPSNLLLEDETHSTRNREHTAEHVLGQKFPITITQQSIVECRTCWELNGKANRGRTNENVIETDWYEGAGTILQLQFLIKYFISTNQTIVTEWSRRSETGLLASFSIDIEVTAIF